MIAISLWQPWASAMFAPRPDDPARPLKRYETRHRPMPRKYQGQRCAIHAAKRRTSEEAVFWHHRCGEQGRKSYSQAFAAIGIEFFCDLPRGCVIGEVIFDASVPVTEACESADFTEFAWGNYELGRWAWPTLSRTLYEKPIPCVGRQGFFVWEPNDPAQTRHE